MARKKRNRSAQRDHFTIASPPAVRIVQSKPLVSDRRLFHPEQAHAPVYSPRKSQRRIVDLGHVSQPNRNKMDRARKSSRGYKMAFGVPGKVELCVRRQQRREVLFALRRTGKGARKVQRRRNYWSGVSCK